MAIEPLIYLFEVRDSMAAVVRVKFHYCQDYHKYICASVERDMMNHLLYVNIYILPVVTSRETKRMITAVQLNFYKSKISTSTIVQPKKIIYYIPPFEF